MSIDDRFPLGPTKPPSPDYISRARKMAEERLRMIEEEQEAAEQIVDDKDQRFIGEEA